MREAESVRATRALRDVHELARLCGIQASYTDHRGRRRRASAEALLAALRAFGVPVERPEQAAGRLRKVRLARWRSPLEPVTVAWDGRLPEFLIRLPSRVAGEPAAWRVELEDGGTMPVQCRAIPGPAEDVEGKRYVGVRIVPDARVPHGYHRLRYRAQGIEATSFLISDTRRPRLLQLMPYSETGSRSPGKPSTGSWRNAP